MGDLFQTASKHNGDDGSGPSVRETAVPCVENVSCEKDEVLGCMVELKAVNSMFMSPQMSSKMCLSRDTLDTRLPIMLVSQQNVSRG